MSPPSSVLHPPLPPCHSEKIIPLLKAKLYGEEHLMLFHYEDTWGGGEANECQRSKG